MEIWRRLSEMSRELADLSEIALNSRSPAELWPSLMERLQRSLGFDAGYVATTRGTADGAHGAVLGHDAEALRSNIGRYLGEISREEIASYTGRARQDDEVWGRRRREELAVFRELLVPAHTKHVLVRASIRGDVLLGFNLERRLARPFGERERALVDALAPIVHAADTFSRSATTALSSFDAWARQYDLTPREQQIAELATRGLQNGEIATLLGVSLFTVRNALVRVFAKADVSTRAELAFIAAQGPGAAGPAATNVRTNGADRLVIFYGRVKSIAGPPPAAAPAVTHVQPTLVLARGGATIR